VGISDPNFFPDSGGRLLRKYLYTEKFKIGKLRMEQTLMHGFWPAKSLPEAGCSKLTKRRNVTAAICGGVEEPASIFFANLPSSRR
jgi:hypothetical protein